MYKLIKNLFNNEIKQVQRLSDNAFIPFDLANTDYQEYLKWLEKGNTPLPAEEVGLQPTADEISE
jgi:hypothetical protein